MAQTSPGVTSPSTKPVQKKSAPVAVAVVVAVTVDHAAAAAAVVAVPLVAAAVVAAVAVGVAAAAVAVAITDVVEFSGLTVKFSKTFHGKARIIPRLFCVDRAFATDLYL